MTAATQTAGRKALVYAEVTLGVHDVYEEALAFRAGLDETLTALGEARDKKRAVEVMLQDAEMNVISEERSTHPEMSQAQMDKHVKVALSKNDTIRALRQQLLESVGDVEGLEFDRTMNETDIKIAVARLHELGGYFEYLAAIKRAESS
jgi:hypothetical protein